MNNGAVWGQWSTKCHVHQSTDNRSDHLDGAAAAVHEFGASLGFTLEGQELLQLIICNEYCFQIYHDARPLKASMSHIMPSKCPQ